jgi:hypothetical protein
MSSRSLWGRSSICKCQRPPAAMQRATVHTHTVCMGLVWCEVWWGRICGGVWWSVVVWCVVWGGVWCVVGLCGVEWVDTVVTITGRRTLCSQHYVHQAGTKTQAVLDAVLCKRHRKQHCSTEARNIVLLKLATCSTPTAPTTLASDIALCASYDSAACNIVQAAFQATLYS